MITESKVFEILDNIFDESDENITLAFQILKEEESE